MSDKISTIDKIITASIELFAQKSYVKTTLQDISTESGAVIGSIYHAFPKGKKDIIKAIVKLYQIKSEEKLGKILKENAINSTLEQTVDNLLKALVELGSEYPCFGDSGFLKAVDEFYEDKQDDQILEYISVLFQLKIPTLSKQQADLKARICNNIWCSLLVEYDLTQDKVILEEIKKITLSYLNQI